MRPGAGGCLLHGKNSKTHKKLVLWDIVIRSWLWQCFNCAHMVLSQGATCNHQAAPVPWIIINHTGTCMTICKKPNSTRFCADPLLLLYIYIGTNKTIFLRWENDMNSMSKVCHDQFIRLSDGRSRSGWRVKVAFCRLAGHIDLVLLHK